MRFKKNPLSQDRRRAAMGEEEERPINVIWHYNFRCKFSAARMNGSTRRTAEKPPGGGGRVERGVEKRSETKKGEE